MKSDFLEFIGNARQRRSEKFRRQLTVFLICTALSFFIWALVRLSKDYYFSLKYDLIFTDIPSHARLTGVSDSTINLRIKFQGFELISERFLIHRERQFEVSLRNLRIRTNGDRVYGYMLTGRIGKEIISQANFPNDEYFVSPDTIFFEFDKSSLQKLSPRAAGSITPDHKPAIDSLRLPRDSAHNRPRTLPKHR